MGSGKYVLVMGKLTDTPVIKAVAVVQSSSVNVNLPMSTLLEEETPSTLVRHIPGCVWVDHGGTVYDGPFSIPL